MTGASVSDRALVSDRAAARLAPSGFDPSRLKAALYDQASRGIDEMAEMLRRQIVAEAAAIAQAAEYPWAAGYLSGRTSQLHDWASRLSALWSIHEGWFRDSDGSGEAGETRSGSTEGDSAGPKGIAQTPASRNPNP